jgi:metallophosphoesterase superfamily enzyme
MKTVLCIADLHCPWERPGYFEFICDLYKEWQCNTVVFIGDLADSHAVSFHQKHPDLPGALQEYELTKSHIKKWYKKFPDATITAGNHDKRIIRLARSVNIPELYLKSYNEIWETPKWHWVDNVVIDDVYYYHGTGQGGEYPAPNAMRKLLMSVVMGHNHTASGVKYYTNPNRRIFACDVGAGCDDKQLAFAYCEDNKRRSVISAAIIKNGSAFVVPMAMGKGERYHDSKFRE